MIQMISVDKIEHHPDNPRKDLGDLTELAESIKQSGILQNLTLVPWFSRITGVGADDPQVQEELGYYAVIGNRRLAAAKLAGLKEVPCVISDMDYKTQIATMLLENMQRADLTVYEQAQGFQQMMNLGETVTDISEKTGFSESTVRRRVKLLELDQEKFKESAERGATLQDYMDLEKIENLELRNKVLETVGTKDFKYNLQKAIDDEKKEKNIARMIEQLDTFATETDQVNNMRYVKNYNTYQNETIEIPDDADTEKYFYHVGLYYITLYKEFNKSEEDLENEEKARIKSERIEARRAELREISERAYKLRSDFIKNMSNTKARKHIDAIIEAALYVMIETYCNMNYKGVSELLNIDLSDKDNIQWEDIADHIWKQPELDLLLVVYDTLDSESQDYYNWSCEYVSNKNLDYIYNLLTKLGYKMSDEEKRLQDGTHELYMEE